MISDGRNINVRTVERYLEGLTESFFLYKASRYDIKGKQYLKTGEKYYLSDLGIRYFILGRKIGDYGHILENIVYLELLRRGYEITIGKVDNLEVDFVCKKQNKLIYIQVSYLLASEETIEREFKPLKNIPDNYPKYVITMDDVDMSHEGIGHLNLIDFLRDNEVI